MSTYPVLQPTATQSSIRVAKDATTGGGGGVRREERGRGRSDGSRDTPASKCMVCNLLV